VPKENQPPQENDKYCAVVSTWPVAYALGEFKDTNFYPKMWHPIDYGHRFYAPNSFVDLQGRRILIGWATVNGFPNWSGCFTLPRILIEGPNDTLLIDPIPELEKLRDQKIIRADFTLEPNESLELLNTDTENDAITSTLHDGTIELRLEIELPNDSSTIPVFELQFLAGVDPSQAFNNILSYDPDEQLFYVGMERGRFVRQANEDTLSIIIYVDRVLSEIFVNRRFCLTHDLTFTESSEICMILKAIDVPLHIKKMEAYTPMALS
jgi:sucrose-6-phosphate hydrolase SacC (GH32 family)